MIISSQTFPIVNKGPANCRGDPKLFTVCGVNEPTTGPHQWAVGWCLLCAPMKSLRLVIARGLSWFVELKWFVHKGLFVSFPLNLVAEMLDDPSLSPTNLRCSTEENVWFSRAGACFRIQLFQYINLRKHIFKKQNGRCQTTFVIGSKLMMAMQFLVKKSFQN